MPIDVQIDSVMKLWRIWFTSGADGIGIAIPLSRFEHQETDDRLTSTWCAAQTVFKAA
jgi:hypothetical protein